MTATTTTTNEASSPWTTAVHRYYIDVRGLTPAGRRDPVHLPLLSTLPPELQQSIQKYLRPADRLMSLSSALLKYYFIHTQARIPWDEVRISRTPLPHGRPYWAPPDGWSGSSSSGTGNSSSSNSSTAAAGLEFNVTHQNGLVGLVGCTTPTAPAVEEDYPTTSVRLGVDVACMREAGRGPSTMTTQAKLDEWIDIFGEMFSAHCRDEIRTAPPPPAGLGAGAPGLAATIQSRLRRFYAFWALKEAYIKMVGEGLLADWLTKLEFEHVRVPQPATRQDWDDADDDDHGDGADTDGFGWALRTPEELKWTPAKLAVKDIRAVLDGRPVEDVQLALVAYEDDFLFATAMRGLVEHATAGAGAGVDGSWRKLDFGTDIRPCAEGRCSCLQGV